MNTVHSAHAATLVNAHCISAVTCCPGETTFGRLMKLNAIPVAASASTPNGAITGLLVVRKRSTCGAGLNASSRRDSNASMHRPTPAPKRACA
jgi:hypothetical protein